MVSMFLSFAVVRCKTSSRQPLTIITTRRGNYGAHTIIDKQTLKSLLNPDSQILRYNVATQQQPWD